MNFACVRSSFCGTSAVSDPELLASPLRTPFATIAVRFLDFYFVEFGLPSLRNLFDRFLPFSHPLGIFFYFWRDGRRYESGKCRFRRLENGKIKVTEGVTEGNDTLVYSEDRTLYDFFNGQITFTCSNGRFYKKTIIGLFSARLNGWPLIVQWIGLLNKNHKITQPDKELMYRSIYL